MKKHQNIGDPWDELTPQQMEVLVATARIVLEGTTQPNFTELATRLGISHQPLSALHFKEYLIRGGRRGPGVTLTGRGWVALARVYGPWREPIAPRVQTSGEFALLQGAHNTLAHVLAGGHPRAKDHALLRTLCQYIREER
jgi:hypothetical protein